MKDINEFYSYYTKEILPFLSDSWESGKGLFRMYLWLFIIFCVFIILIVFYTRIWWILFFLAGAGFLFWLFSRNISASENLRSMVIRKILFFINENLHYKANDSLAGSRIRKLGIFNASFPSKFKVSDSVSGKISGRFFSMEFVTVLKIGVDILSFYFNWPSDEPRYKDSVAFQGILGSFEFNKDFHAATAVVSKGWGSKEIFKLSTAYGKMEKVELENPNFAETFDVYSGSQQEARYILTPTFMEALLRFAVSVGGRPSFYFSDSHFFLWINKNVWDVSDILEREDNFIKIVKLYVYISEILDSILDLHLDVRIWTKK